MALKAIRDTVDETDRVVTVLSDRVYQVYIGQMNDPPVPPEAEVST